MGEAALRVPSFEELYRRIVELPQGMTGEILEPGTLRTMSRPGGLHRRSARRSLRALRAWDVDEGGHGWWFEVEAEIRLLGDRLAVPDLAGWRVANVPEFIDDNPISVVPDWCCEVLSPTTTRDDRRLKLPLYAKAGVGWIWLVDPELRMVEVFQTRDGLATFVLGAQEDEQVLLMPFDAPIALGAWWHGEAGAGTR